MLYFTRRTTKTSEENEQEEKNDRPNRDSNRVPSYNVHAHAHIRIRMTEKTNSEPFIIALYLYVAQFSRLIRTRE